MRVVTGARRGRRSAALRVAVAAVALALTGCASTRTMQFGQLTGTEALVTLVVSEDPDVVKRECLDASTETQLLGCQMSHVVHVDTGDVRAVKIVRYTDTLPSEMAFEIDAHELCHAIAAVQGLEDPCHRENQGVVQADRVDRRAPVLR